MSMRILGIDPGVNTGLALIEAGALVQLRTVQPLDIVAAIEYYAPERIVMEDSRLQSFVWTAHGNKAATLKMARNLGEVDAWCRLIAAVCEKHGIACHGISPAGKGRKMAAESFRQAVGWEGRSNQHERDAAMVAWPYRHLRGKACAA